MHFKSRQIKGKGRGKKLGFPTINLTIPPDLSIEYGVYAVYVDIRDKKFKGALHYGPVPTFNENKPSLEVFLIGENDKTIPPLSKTSINIIPVKKIRGVINFDTAQELKKQMIKDVAAAIILLTDE